MGEGCQEAYLTSLPQNWELREALDRKSRECEELRQELAKAQAKKLTRIPVPSHIHNDHHTLPAGEGCRRVEPQEVVQGRGEDGLAVAEGHWVWKLALS